MLALREIVADMSGACLLGFGPLAVAGGAVRADCLRPCTTLVTF